MRSSARRDAAMSDQRPPRVQARPVGPQRGTVRQEGGVRRTPGSKGGGRSARWSAILAISVLAVLIIVVGVALLRPAVSDWAVGFAKSNPQALRMGFVADLVAGALGAELTDPVSDDDTPVPFEVASGATASDVAAALAEAGLISQGLVFEYAAITSDQADSLQAGTYELSRAMTPQAILARSQDAPVLTVSVGLREGLRIEQIAAYLQTIDIRRMQPRSSTSWPRSRPQSSWPTTHCCTLPKGASLEGFLQPDTYEVVTASVTARSWSVAEPDRILLNQFSRSSAMSRRMDAESRGMSFYEVLTLATIVEHEAGVDEERAIIAGVYQNRLDGPRGPPDR